MRNINAFIVFVLFVSIGNVFAQTESGNQRIFIKKITNSELSVKTAGSERRCRVDRQVVDVKLSSDGQAVIISGTSYIPTAALEHCKADVVTHARQAAPHVGFLSDVNLKAHIYASLVPVSVNPMSFLAVVGKIGSDRNLVNRPGFYRVGVNQSMLLSEASSDITPTLSLDARYVTLDLHSCGSGKGEDVFVTEIHSGKQIKLSPAMCEKIFHFQ